MLPPCASKSCSGPWPAARRFRPSLQHDESLMEHCPSIESSQEFPMDALPTSFRQRCCLLSLQLLLLMLISRYSCCWHDSFCPRIFLLLHPSLSLHPFLLLLPLPLFPSPLCPHPTTTLLQSRLGRKDVPCEEHFWCSSYRTK